MWRLGVVVTYATVVTGYNRLTGHFLLKSRPQDYGRLRNRQQLCCITVSGLHCNLVRVVGNRTSVVIVSIESFARRPDVVRPVQMSSTNDVAI